MRTEQVFGFHAVQSLLNYDRDRIQQLIIQEGRNDARLTQLLDSLKHPVPVQLLSRAELDELTGGGSHQGVVALCTPASARNERFLECLLDTLEQPAFLLVLDGVTDPHNLGACLRSADAAGVQAVIAPKDKSASLNATVAKVACGAAQVIPFVQVTNLARTLQNLQQRGIWIAGTAGEAEQSVFQANLTGPLALVMGAEGKGLRRLTREHCDFLIKIPMAGEVSSLNVSVATGVCLFEAVRQRLKVT